MMSKQRTVKNNGLNDSFDKLNESSEHINTCPSTKLERRRRIEELNEEKRLKEELDMF